MHGFRAEGLFADISGKAGLQRRRRTTTADRGSGWFPCGQKCATLKRYRIWFRFSSGITHEDNNTMNLHLALTPLISLLAGILILVMPKLLNFIVAIYLIAVGLIGLFGSGALRVS